MLFLPFLMLTVCLLGQLEGCSLCPQFADTIANKLDLSQRSASSPRHGLPLVHQDSSSLSAHLVLLPSLYYSGLSPLRGDPRLQGERFL